MTKSPKLFVQSVSAILIAFFITSFALLNATAVQAAATASIQNQSTEQQQIGQLTAELNQLLSQYRRTSAEEQDQIEQQLTALATERQQLLAEVIESDPHTILKYALPEKVQAQFPAQVQEKFEQWVHAQGEFEIFYEDHHKHENSRLRYFLKQDNKHFELAVSGNNLPVQTSGHSVWVQGVLVPKGGNPFIATNDEQIMLAAGGSGDPETSGSTAELAYASGEQRTAVFLVNFEDDPTKKPWSTGSIDNVFFTSVSNFYLENSYQQTWLTGDVFGWFTVPLSSTVCDPIALADAADSLAVSQQIDLSQYDRFVYVFPENSCGWAGVANVGGSKTRAWVNGNPFGNTPAHELGHNLGLFHSNGLNCEGDVLDTNCVAVTYGDSLDTMGGFPAHFNAFQKERLGWLNQSQTPPIVDVQQSGSYAIELYETTTNNAKVLKVFKDIDPATGTNRWYYIEFRQPVGEDAFIADSPYLFPENITNGVIVHIGSDDAPNSIKLLDMTPESTPLYTGNFYDLYDPALVSGQSFTDASSGLTIFTEYTDSQTATVYVDMNGGSQTCINRNPIIAVSPTESQWVAAGTTVDYTISVTNQDSSNCSAASFNVSADVPAGWNSNSPQLSLAPGETGSVTMSITSATDAVDDFYDIILTATNADNSSYSNTTTATYVISSGSSNSAPDAVDDSVTMTAIEPIVINVMANDSDPELDSISISAVGSPAKGDVSVNADGTLIYTPAKRFKDKDSFTYTISDGQASDTATVALTLQASSADESGNTKGGGNGGSKGGGKPTK